MPHKKSPKTLRKMTGHQVMEWVFPKPVVKAVDKLFGKPDSASIKNHDNR